MFLLLITSVCFKVSLCLGSDRSLDHRSLKLVIWRLLVNSLLGFCFSEFAADFQSTLSAFPPPLPHAVVAHHRTAIMLFAQTWVFLWAASLHGSDGFSISVVPCFFALLVVWSLCVSVVRRRFPELMFVTNKLLHLKVKPGFSHQHYLLADPLVEKIRIKNSIYHAFRSKMLDVIYFCFKL